MNAANNFDLNLLRVFDALWRHRHVGRAADELGMSQPAVSHALQRMRDLLGDALFIKVRAGMQPSSRATALAPTIHNVLAEVRSSILVAPRFEPVLAERTFNIAMSDLGEAFFLPRLLARLMRDAPGVNVNTVSSKAAELPGLLERSQVDLVIGFFPDLGGADIFQQRLFQHGFVCLVRKEHPVVKGKLSAKQFIELPHAVVQSEGRTQEIVEQYLRSNGITRRQLLKSTQFLSIPLVIAETDLVVTVPLPVGELFARLANIQIIKPPFPIPTFELRQHWHRCQHADPANRWLRTLTLEMFSKPKASMTS